MEAKKSSFVPTFWVFESNEIKFPLESKLTSSQEYLCSEDKSLKTRSSNSVSKLPIFDHQDRPLTVDPFLTKKALELDPTSLCVHKVVPCSIRSAKVWYV